MNPEHKLRESLNKINLSPNSVTIEFGAAMSGHSTFRIGGPADVLARPRTLGAMRQLLDWARVEKLPVFVLGGGANILVADAGVRGLVVDMTGLNACTLRPDRLIMEVQAGLPISDAAEFAAATNLAGLEFIYRMPGSVGGAVYMNARCYGAEIADVLVSVDYLDANLVEQTMVPDRSHFKYKDTPFMGQPWIITAARFQLRPGDPATLQAKMLELAADRTAKGHFAAPCAGSMFKNNHAFGQPSGKIIDSLGLRGFRIGDAKISDGHANIFINAGNATAADMRTLIDYVRDRVRKERGFELEPEVVMVGDWD